MLNTPDVRQAEDYDCGPAAMDCALRCFGVHATASSLAVTADESHGTHPAAIEHGFWKAGLNVQSGRMTLADLAHHTRLGRAILCPIALFGGHWVVVRGVTAKRVYYHCPSEGRRWVTRDRWLAMWHDSERPNHSFVNWGIAVWGNKL